MMPGGRTRWAEGALARRLGAASDVWTAKLQSLEPDCSRPDRSSAASPPPASPEAQLSTLQAT